MAIGERIHYFRLLRGFTQKYLGKLLGFSDSQADVRIAQYEKGARSPKEKYLNALAQIFEVSPHALNVPDIDTDIGLMHTLFTLEDTRGLKIGKLDGELCLRLDKDTGMTYGISRQRNWSPARSPKKNTISGVIPILKWRLNKPAGNWTLCVKSGKLKTIQIKKSQQKRSCQIDFSQFSKTFSIGFSWIYLIASDEK